MKDDYIMELKPFSEVDLDDPFFDTLKKDYGEFSAWFTRKAEEKAYVGYDADGRIIAFLYLKIEEGPITDIEPSLDVDRVLKVGTFKIEAHGTNLGERFVKKIFDYALNEGINDIYITIFDKYQLLINLLGKFGFEKYGEKETPNGIEQVYIKRIEAIHGDVIRDYPVIRTSGVAKFLLGIYPKFHTNLFPDSILHTETFDMLKDITHTNSIFKTYVCRMDIHGMKPEDILVIYRTTDEKAPAEYRSVASTVCTVIDVKYKNVFKTQDEYLKFALKNSVFTESELVYLYNNPKWIDLKVIKMVYNVALRRRLTRQRLADEVGLDRKERWSCLPMSDDQFMKICRLGEINESVIAD